MDKLAIHGGSPSRKEYLPYGKQWIDEEDIEKVCEVLRGDFLTTGPNIKDFEESIASYVGTKYAVAFCNGTAALHGACYAAGIGPGDEVLVSAMTFAASANCVLYCGGTPVFVDIHPKYYNMDISKIEEKISSRTKAIIPVDYTGQSVDIDAIMDLAKKHDLIVIEDAAHALGSTYKGKKVGSISHMTEFSFHPVKPITTGEGGAIVTNDFSYYQKLCSFRSHGMIRDKDLLSKEEGPWYHEQQTLGYNYRLTDIQCALGVSQMNKLDLYVNKRRELAKKYTHLLKDMDGLVLPYEEAFSSSGWHLYILQLELDKFTVSRREVFEALVAENIGVNVHYLPVYLHPYYQKLGYQKGLCPNAENLYDSLITLPLFPKMEEEDVLEVVDALSKVISCYKKSRILQEIRG